MNDREYSRLGLRLRSHLLAFNGNPSEDNRRHYWEARQAYCQYCAERETEAGNTAAAAEHYADFAASQDYNTFKVGEGHDNR